MDLSLESILPSEQEEKPSQQPLDSPSLRGGHLLKKKWLEIIISKREKVTALMRKVLLVPSNTPTRSMSEPFTFKEEPLPIRNLHFVKVVSHSIPSPIFPPLAHERQKSLMSLSSSQKIQKLRDKGYLSLADKLENEKGYPWDECLMLSHPLLMEQLVEITLFCEKNKLEKEKTERLIDFSFDIASLITPIENSDHSYNSSELFNDAKHLLGQLIYLLNQDPEKALNAIKIEEKHITIQKINELFNDHIESICERLHEHYFAHFKTQFQDPDVSLQTKIPYEIAKALLTNSGTINVGIIELLTDIFLVSEKLINSQINLSHALRLLQQSPKLREEFTKIGKPLSEKTPSNRVIRTSLSLPNDAPIDHYHARLTALTAILSHLRQGEDRSCFAVSLAIEILASHLNFCFKDLRQLLEEGKLTRRLKDVSKDIPFVLKISDENLHKIIKFNPQGELLVANESTAPLWEIPGLLEACRAVDVEFPKETILSVIKKFPPLHEKKFYKIEIKTLIQKICEEQIITKEFSPSLLDQACFAFSSQTTQPLLKVWENAIANMAEVEEGGMIKTAIMEAVLDSLQYVLGKMNIQPSTVLQRFFISIQRFLYQEISLQYDPLIEYSTQKSKETEKGGFVLYSLGARIDTEKLFLTLIEDILKRTVQEIKKNEISLSEGEQLDQVIKILFSYLRTEECMNYLIARYHPSNPFITSLPTDKHPFTKIRSSFTPWITQTGNNSKALMKTYFEANHSIKSDKFITHNAEIALISVIEFCKKMPSEEKELYLKNPHKLKSLCIQGKHRLPFMVGNPSLVTAWLDTTLTQSWVEKNVVAPGRAVALSLIDIPTKNNFIKSLRTTILPDYFSLDLITSYEKKTKEIHEKLTIQEYRDQILNICQRLRKWKSATSFEKFRRLVDTALCRSLQPELKKKLEKCAIHFADTNWSKGIQDLHFCFAVNPGNGKLELWEAYANGNLLKALDQKYWLQNQTWEFLTIKEEILIDDFSMYA